MPTEVFIGVDVCKPRLDLMILLAHKTAPHGPFALPTGEILEFENSSKGIKQFVKRPKPEAILPEGAWLGSRRCCFGVKKHVKKLKPTLITCECTGGLEQPLLIACTDAGLPIAVINPKQARDFARAILDPTPAPS
jgi:transposase